MKHIALWTLLGFAPSIFTFGFSTFNPLILKSVSQLIPLDKTFYVKDPLFTNNRSLNLKLPYLSTFFNPALTSFDDRGRTHLRQSLPSTLKQFGIPDTQIQGMVDRGVPLVLDTVKELLGQEKGEGHALRARSFLGDILDWAGDAGCSLVAAAGFSLYAIAAADYTVANSNGASTNAEQDFFLTPSHGDLAHSAPVKIYYSATQLPFKDVPGITFNRNVFLNTPLVPEYTVETRSEFAALIRLLIHEFTHVEQYRKLGYDLVSFGHAYMFQWCKAGFKYSNIDYEVEARSRERDSDELLLFGNPGNAFFWVWKYGNLQSQLGSPTARAPSTPLTHEAGSELLFQRGVLQINDLNANPPQYRTFTSDELTQRAAAKCSTTHPVCLDLKPRSLDPRSPMPPGGHVDPPDVCPKDLKDQAVRRCEAAKASWKTLQQSRVWKTDVTIPHAPHPPPPPKPGCPPNCQIITLVPVSSKSCQLDNPPQGRDRADAEENNRNCRSKLAQCA